MKQKKGILFSLLLAFAFSLLQPATIAYAAPKYFTYAEQNTGATVSSLFLEPGQQVDLKFMGVKDYKNYTRKWTSSNEAVATVDSNGLITARTSGTATIKLIVGNETEYTSSGVTVTVGKQNTIALGTSSGNTFSTKDLKVGASIDLGFYGMQGWDSSRYTCAWVSTNPAVATVDQAGIVNGLKTGRTFIMLLITDRYTTSSLTVTPVSLNVVEKTVTPTATPVPTAAPTKAPDATIAPTAVPTQAPSSGSYTVAVASTDSIYVKFPAKVSFDEDEISLGLLEEGSDTEIQDDCSFEIIWNANGKEAVIENNFTMYDGERYLIRFGENDKGTIFEVQYKEPNRIEVTYECMGQEGVAFAQVVDGLDLPVSLSYRLYYNNVDVTEEYDDGYVEFELISPNDSAYVEFDGGDELIFYATKKTAVVRATYNYEADGEDKTLRSPSTSITAKSASSYSVSIEEWTIIDDNSKAKINWSNPVHKVGAGTSGHKIVLLLEDTFGIQYATDDRGVNESKDIYSLEDEDKFFGAMGYSMEFTMADMDDVFVDYDGMVDIYEEAPKKATVSLMLYNEYDSNFKEKKAGSFSLQILPAPELASISADKASVTLLVDCLDGYEKRFCQTEININMFDQYENVWNGDYSFELSCDNRDIDSALGDTSSPAYLKNNVLHIDAQALWSITEDTSVTFTVKEEEINKRTTVKVSLKKPRYDSDDNIAVTGWNVAAENVKIDFANNNYIISSAVEAFKVSQSLNVGLYTDVTVIAKTSYTPDKTAEVGDVFIMVTGPDNKAVPLAANENSLGVYWDDDDNCVRVNVAAPESGKTVDFLSKGKYKIKAIRVTGKEEDGTPETTQDTATFTVSEALGTVKVNAPKTNKTETYVHDKEDVSSVCEIIEELFSFTLDGKDWNVTANMIENVTFTRKEKYIIVKTIELKVPIGETGYNYVTTIKNVGITVQHGIDE